MGDMALHRATPRGSMWDGPHLFSRRSLDWIEGGMLEPVTVVEIVDVQQGRVGADTHLSEPLFLGDAGAAMGYQTGLLCRLRAGEGLGLSGELGHALERLFLRQQVSGHVGGAIG